MAHLKSKILPYKPITEKLLNKVFGEFHNKYSNQIILVPLTKKEWKKYQHNPNVPGFKSLINLFSRVISGEIKYNIFMTKWNKTSKETRTEFHIFMKTFQEITDEVFKEEIFKC